MVRACFLDKDGTIVEDPHYMVDESQLKIIPGAIESIKRLRELGFKIIVVTNQSQVGRGMITEDKLKSIMNRMDEMFRNKGAIIDRIYYCPHHPDIGCSCRKPSSLLFEQAKKDFDIDFTKSYLIGDLYSDILAAKKIGCKSILVLTGYGKISLPGCFPDYVANNIKDAFDIIEELE